MQTRRGFRYGEGLYNEGGGLVRVKSLVGLGTGRDEPAAAVWVMTMDCAAATSSDRGTGQGQGHTYIRDLTWTRKWGSSRQQSVIQTGVEQADRRY